MNKITKGLYKLGFQLKKHSPEILFGIGIVGIISAPILSAIGTMKAQDRIEEYYDEVPEEDRTKLELAKRVVPCYIPTAATVGATIAAFAGEKKETGQRTAAIMSLLASERQTNKILVEKMKEKFGPGKAEDVVAETRKEVEKQHRMKSTKCPEETAYHTGLGDLLIYDNWQSRYFYASVDAVMHAETTVNNRLKRGELWVPWNDFLGLMNLPYMKAAEKTGWYEFDDWLEVEKTWTETSSGQQLLIIDYIPYPIPGLVWEQ